MNKSTAQIEIDGTFFEGWKSIALDFDIESVSSSFSFSARDKDNVLSDLDAGVKCRILINEDIIVMDGFITKRDETITATSHDIVITGSDKLIDAVECAAIYPSQTWTSAKFSSIVRDLLSPFEIQIDSSRLTDDPIIKKLTIQSGETAFDTIERLCRSQAVIPTSSLGGKLDLTYAAIDTDRAADNLVIGTNLKKLKKTSDWSERFSDYIGLSQMSGNGKKWTEAMVRGKAEAFDRGVTRYRPKVFVAEGRLEPELLNQRVAWEAQVRAGRSVERMAVVDGWFKKNEPSTVDTMWKKNKRTSLIIGDTSEELLISSVSMSLDSSGEQTTIGLRHPDTYKQDPTMEVEL